MPLLAIAALAAGTYAFRLAGPLSGNRLRVPRRLQHLTVPPADRCGT
jgi:hypothetical protein